MGGETLEDELGEREVSATGERAEQTFFRRSAWTISEVEVLGSRALYLLPCSLAVTRKGPINLEKVCKTVQGNVS